MICEKIETNRESTIAFLMQKAGVLPQEAGVDFDVSSLVAVVREDLGFEPKGLENLEYEELYEALLKEVSQAYEEKMSVVDSAQRNEIERIIYLQVLDNAWREHLYVMDNLKTGIGLRGYNQKDPLVEYKKESYNLFLEFVENLKIETTKTLQIVRLKPQDQVEEFADKVLQELEEANVSFNKDNTDTLKKQTKIARNDPCPCGSGKKYKLCHGKSGPKKGLLA